MAQPYGELVDSSALLSDPSALRDRFATDGYLFFRGLLDADRVHRVRRAIVRELAALGWPAPDADLDGERVAPGPEVHFEGSEHWTPGYVAIQRLETFHELAFDEPLVAVAAAVLGEDDILVHPRKIARVTFPRSRVPTPPHQDFPLIQGAPDVCTAWVPFMGCGDDLGALRVLEGSHASGLREHQPTPGIGGTGLPVPEEDPRWRSTTYEVGDALFFHSFTVHWAPGNEGSWLRLSADYRYQSLGDPVVEGSLHPHGFPLVPDWHELTGGWSTTAWVDVPAAPAVNEWTAPPVVTAASRIVTAG